MAKQRHSTRKLIDEDLGLQYPLAELRTNEAPRNREVLLHLFHLLRNKEGRTSLDEASRITIEPIKTAWRGSCVEITSRLYKLYE